MHPIQFFLPVTARRPLPILALLPALCLCAGSCREKPEQATASPPRPVKVLEIQDSGATQIVEFPGQINAVRKSWKAFEVPGRVIERLVKEGENVTKGQVLARLDPRDYQYAFDAAKAQHEAALQVATRIRELNRQKAVSRQELDLAERDLRQADANLKRAEKALEDTQLIADFDGRVAQLLIDDFTNVVAKENVMLIQDNTKLEIVINIPESAVAIPVEGQTSAEKVARTRPEVILSVFPDQVFPATYREASEHPDPATRTYQVKLTFSTDEKSPIRPGMTAKVRAYIPANTTPELKGFPIPTHALFSRDNGSSQVWKIDPESMTVTAVNVTTGTTRGGNTLVQGELSNGDRIVVSGVHQLHAGDKVSRWNTTKH